MNPVRSALPRVLVFLLAVAGTVLIPPPGSGSRSPRPATAGPSSYDDDIQSRQKQLEDLKQQAAAKRSKARDLAEKERGVLHRLNEAEQAIAASRDYLRGLEQRHADLEREIGLTETGLKEAQALLGVRKEALGRRLRFSYMYGKARALEVVFAADSFADLLQRGAFLRRVLQQDERLIQEVEEREAAIAEKLNRLRERQAELARVQEDKLAEQRQYEKLKSERARSLSQVRNQREEHEAAARELEAAAEQMSKVLAELERKRREAMRRHSPVLDQLDRNDFGQNRGRLPWPVNGDVISGFGPHEHPKYKTVTLNNGLDLAAPVGTPVVSVGDGVVDLVQWLPGYGQTVIVNHGRGFYTIYAHLSAVTVAPGARVAPGEQVGAVGDTGSLKGPCLHFELRSGGSAQDPQLWLR